MPSVPPLADWLNENVHSVPSTMLHVEGSFNHTSNIIKSGRGCRAVSTQVSMQAHLQNQALPSRPKLVSQYTGEIMKWRPTKDNLSQYVQAFLSSLKIIRSVAPETVQKLEADYNADFIMNAARAKPARRKQFNAETEAQCQTSKCPYADDDDDDEDDGSDGSTANKETRTKTRVWTRRVAIT